MQIASMIQAKDLVTSCFNISWISFNIQVFSLLQYSVTSIITANCFVYRLFTFIASVYILQEKENSLLKVNKL